MKKSYRGWLPVIYPLLIVVPLLALLGFWGVGVELRTRAATATPSAQTSYGMGYDAIPGYDSPAGHYTTENPDPAKQARLEEYKDTTYVVYLGAILLVLVARSARRRWRVRGGGVYKIFHANGRAVTAHIGQSLLEALRAAGIPHASVCGGRARCTTCRVRVGRGLDTLPPANPAEIPRP